MIKQINTFRNMKKAKGIAYVIDYSKKYCFDFTFHKLYLPMDKLFQKTILFFTKKKKLKNIIIIESHNDFDCNGGAFYDYLINNGFNKKYVIVWLIKNQKPKGNFPQNVKCFNYFKPSIRKAYYICNASILTADDRVTDKVREDQKSFYLTHGSGGFKNIKGKMNIADSVDYVLLQSESYAPVQAEQYALMYPSDRIICIGYPAHDVINNRNTDDLKKLGCHNYKKIILWMPTFRKGGGLGRIDSMREQPLGIPLINTFNEYEHLNEYLKGMEVFLIIKIHPMQDISELKITDQSNIAVLTGSAVKEKKIDNYRLMSCVDAMLSDYSGAAYEFLQTNRPIAYDLSDVNEYKLGFVVEDIRTLMGGPCIYTLDDMKDFIKRVVDGQDDYQTQREKVRNFIYKYNDTDNCKRLAEFMELNKQ